MLDYADVIILRAAAGVRGVGAAGVEVAGLQRHVVPEAEAGEAQIGPNVVFHFSVTSKLL